MSFLSAYRSIGQFVSDSDNSMHQSICLLNQKCLISLCSKKFNIYSLPSLQLKISGPKMKHKIRCIESVNEDVFISQKQKVIRIRYWSIIKEYQGIHQSNIKGIMMMDNVMITWDHNNLVVVRQIQKNLNRHNQQQESSEDGKVVVQIQLDQDILQILHPSTLLNKVLISTPYNLYLYNLNTGKKIYSFKAIDCNGTRSTNISQICLSPVFHVIAISFTDNLVQLLDIITDKIIDRLQVDDSRIIKQMMFTSNDQPFLMIIGSFGLFVYDLNKKRVVERVDKCQEGIDYIGQSTDGFIYIANGSTNSISQWAIQQDQLILNALDSQQSQISDRLEKVRQLNGIQGNINKVRFFDNKGFEIIVSSDHSQCSLRNILINNQCFYPNYSTVTKQQKKNKQKMKDFYDHDTTIKQVSDFQFSHTNKFNKILTQIKDSKDYQIFDSENKRIIQQKLNVKQQNDNGHFESIYNQQQYVDKLWMSNCGNYGLIGYNKGLLIKINIQSSRIQNYCNRPGNIDLVLSDTLNRNIIVGQNTTLYQLDFLTLKQTNSLQLEQQIHNYSLNHLNNLLAVSLTNGTIYIVNLNNTTKLELCRSLKWHTQSVTDMCFNSYHLYSCSLDQLLIVWDIISGSRLHTIKFDSEYPLRSIDISFDGSMLVGVFMHTNQICLWHNRTIQQQYSSEVINDEGFINVIEQDQLDGRVYQINNVEQREQANQQNQEARNIISNSNIKEYLNIDIRSQRNDENLIQFSSQDINKWLPLIDLEQIKQQSKVEITEQIETRIPFFLDFGNKDQVKEQYQSEIQNHKENKSKIVNQEKKKYMNELNNDLDKFISLNDGNPEQVLNFLKTLTPSEIDYQFRQNCFSDPIKLLNLFSVWFENNHEFDLKSTYFNCLLKVSYDGLISSKEAKQILKEIKYKEKSIREKLQRHMTRGLALLEKFTKIKG